MRVKPKTDDAASTCCTAQDPVSGRDVLSDIVLTYPSMYDETLFFFQQKGANNQVLLVRKQTVYQNY